MGMTNDEFRTITERALARAAARESRRFRRNGGDTGPWYLVRAVGRSDLKAVEWLNRMGIETYYPMILQMKRVPRRELSRAQRASGIEIKRAMRAPLFPRYVFARLEMARADWASVFATSGLCGLMCEGGRPVRVRDTLIETIKGRESDGAVPGAERARLIFGIGDAVTVTDGPFASFPALIEVGIDKPIEQLDPEDRIKVVINIFGRATPVELEAWQVAKRD